MLTYTPVIRVKKMACSDDMNCALDSAALTSPNARAESFRFGLRPSLNTPSENDGQGNGLGTKKRWGKKCVRPSTLTRSSQMPSWTD